MISSEWFLLDLPPSPFFGAPLLAVSALQSSAFHRSLHESEIEQLAFVAQHIYGNMMLTE